MFSFWPSFSLLVFFLVILLECRAIAGRVTLPLGGVLMVFCYGAIGAPLLALLLQQVLTPSDASAESMRMMAWLIAPPIEELAKALPVIVLAFLTREARRLSIADLTLIGFASGAGFGFVEGNLNAMVNGTLPGLTQLASLGLQTGNGAVFFAGHAVATALVGLAAGIGLRFLPLKIAYAWAPAGFAILWVNFDHGIYNWKLLNTDSTGALPNAHFVVELLHTAALKGQLATWLLLAGVIIAQFFEAYLCSKAVGARRDLLLAREWRPWVVNEWLVVLLRARLGRAAFGQTLGYFRLRRAFYLASFEARRDPGDPTWTRHAHVLGERLKRERSILFDPPPGTWLLPFPVLKTYAAEWTWRMRWVLVFAVLFVFLFLLGPSTLPDWLRQFLYGETFTISVVTAGLAFAVWQIVLFIRQPRPDPLAAEGAACAAYYTRALLLACSFVCGLFPAATLLFGWKAFAPGAAFLSGYLPGWIGQGGNLTTLLGLGAIGSAVAPDPRPPGEPYRHEIAAADERIRRLALDIEERTGAGEPASPAGARPIQLDAFLEAMAKLDAERDAQARRQLVLDECERHAGEATIADPAPAAQAVKDEFERLASELLDAAAKELDAIASLEQAYGRAWAEIMQDLDAHDVLRRRLSVPLHAAWQAHGDIDWALRVVEATDEGLLPMQLTLLPELRAVATGVQSARADIVAAGIERIRETAGQYGEEDPFTFAGTGQADDDEAALLAEFTALAPAEETPKAFGLRAPQPVETPAPPADDPAAKAILQPAPNRVQRALDQLIGTTEEDARYLETIRHLERSAEALRQPITPVKSEPQSTAPAPIDERTEAAPEREGQDELDSLINAIKRDSGYLDFTKDTQAAQSDAERVSSEPADTAPEVEAPAVEVADDRHETPDIEAPAPALGDVADEAIALLARAESIEERVEQEESVSTPAPEPVTAALPGTLAIEGAQTPDDVSAPEAETAVDEPIVDATPFVPAEFSEPEETLSPHAPEPVVAPLDVLAAAISDEAPVAAEPQDVATLTEPVAERVEPITEVSEPSPEPAARGQEPGESFALVAEDEPVADAEKHEPAAAPLTLGQTDQLSLPLSPAPPDTPVHESPRKEKSHAETPEPLRTKELTARTGTSERIAVEKPAAIEPTRPAIEPAQPREPDEPASKADIRSSLFTRLFQSIKRQSAESTAKPARWDQPKPLDAKPAEPIVTPRLDDQAPSQPKTRSSETAPKSDWLADFGASKPYTVVARAGDTQLEPIEWPAPSRTADVDHPAPVRADPIETRAADDSSPADDITSSNIAHTEVATPTVDAEPLESSAPVDDPVVESAAETEPVATAVIVDTIDVEPEALAEHATDSPVAERSVAVESAVTPADEPAQPTSTAPVAGDASAQVEKPQGGDEFASKADRLSYLLTKLEQAIQAKAAAPTVPSGAPASAATDAAPTPPTEIAVESIPQTQAGEAPIVEPASEEPQQPTAQTAHEETATPLAEAFVTPAQPVVDAHAAAAESLPVEESAEHQTPTEAQLKPERLSFLLNKLFDVAQRESVERPAVSKQADPEPLSTADIVPPADVAAAYPAESEILDLRGPDPLPEPPDEAEPIAGAPLLVQHTAKSEEAPTAPTPIEPVAVEVHVAPTRSETKPAEIEASAPPQSETQAPTPTTDVAPAAAAPQPQPSEQGATPKRPRPAEPATHFGSRSRPPRAGTRALDAKSKPAAAARAPEQPATAPQQQPASPQRVVASADTEPASMPRRDWKLARSEPSKPVDASTTTEVSKKPEIRVKTGSGALATTDEAPITSPAATANTPGKSYGPRLAKDDEPAANSNTPAQQRALGLADALTQYYAKTGEPQPPMHTTDRATLQRITSNGKLEAPKRRGAAWSISGMSRRGEVAIRLKPGAEQFIEFVPSNEIFGQVAHYYPRGVGKGSFATHIPAGHLEYFDVTVHQWVPLLRGRE